MGIAAPKAPVEDFISRRRGVLRETWFVSVWLMRRMSARRRREAENRELRANVQKLRLRLRGQLHLTVGDVHTVLDGLAAVLFAELFGFFLHKRTEAIQ